jgi:hypothetical protein
MSANATTLPLEDRLIPRRPLRDRIGDLQRRFTGPAFLGGCSLAVIVICSAAVVVAAAGHPSFLSAPTRPNYFPGWMAGPLGGLWPWSADKGTMQVFFSVALALSFVSYALAIHYSRGMRVGVVVTAIVAVHLILFLSPPLTLTDVFNYFNYARMEVVHHLNPYVTTPVLEPHGDPSFALSNWHGLLSPYGPLFTIYTFALAKLTPAQYLWTFKSTLMLADLGVLVLTWRCARLLGRDPLRALVIVGLNPIVLFWGLGAAHNDFFAVFFVLLGLYLMLLSAKRDGEPAASAAATPSAPASGTWSSLAMSSRRGGLARAAAWLTAHHGLDAAAGASFVVAAGVKASTGVLIPVALASLVKRPRRLLALALGVLTAALLVGAASLHAFGPHFPDVALQNELVTGLSLPNLTGLALGLGGETTTLHNVLNLALAATIVAACLYAWRRGEVFTAAGWATFAIVVTLSWVLPWYVLWMLPLAALAGSRRLETAALLLGAFLILIWAPLGVQLLDDAGVHPGRTTLAHVHMRVVGELLRP